MKSKYFLFLFLTLTFIHQTSSIATIRYVSKSGTSTPPYTSWETAADSIQKCINICVDGDTVYVANGIYKENLIINTAISLIGSSMDSTVIDGRGMGNNTITFNIHGKIENFNIYGYAAGIGTAVYGITANFPTIEIKQCRISETLRGIGCFGIIAENLILNNLWGGINTSAQPTSYNKIFNCLMCLDRESSNGISLTGPNYADYYINNNIILYTGEIFNNPGNGISIGAPRSVHITSNLISEFGTDVFVESPSDTVFIKNNILINRSDTGILTSGGGWVVVNNVVFNKNKIGIRGNWRVDSDYNMFWESQTNLMGVTMGDSDFVADPMFVKDTIPTVNGDYDFHLQAFSPAIDKGNPNILDLDGTRSDIGMYGGPFGESYTYQDLAPFAPRNLSAIVDSISILVKWNTNTEADTAFYKVYRDTTTNFIIDSTKLVSSSTDTFFVQPNPHINTRYVYTVTCVDKQGNESKPSEEIVVDLTSVSTDEYPMTINDYLLYQNYPNPFNPSTKIGYKLKERAYVKLMVYDIKGELISLLVNKEQNAGYYEADFDVNGQMSNVKSNLASGIYLYRIEIIGEGRIPVYTEMKKMLLIK